MDAKCAKARQELFDDKLWCPLKKLVQTLTSISAMLKPPEDCSFEGDHLSGCQQGAS